METAIQRQKRIEANKRLRKVLIQNALLQFIILMTLTFFFGSITVGNVIRMIIVIFMFMINTIVLRYVSTDLKTYKDEPGLFFITPTGRKQLLITLISSSIIGVISFIQFSHIFGFANPSFEVDENKSLFGFMGFFIGFASGVILLFVDRLYIPLYAVREDQMKSLKQIIITVINQTILCVVIFIFIYLFIMMWVKIYYLAVYGYDKQRVNTVHLTLANVLETIIILIYYSISLRWNFNWLSRVMSVELPLDDKIN